MEFAIKKALSRIRYVLYTGRDWIEPLLHGEKDEVGADLDKDRIQELEEAKRIITFQEEKGKIGAWIPDTRIDERAHLSVIPEGDELALELDRKELLVTGIGEEGRDLEDLEHPNTEVQAIRPVSSKSPTQAHCNTDDPSHIIPVSDDSSRSKATYPDAPEPRYETLESQRSSLKVDDSASGRLDQNSDREDGSAPLSDAGEKVYSQLVKTDNARVKEEDRKEEIIAETKGQLYAIAGGNRSAKRSCASGEISPEPVPVPAVPTLHNRVPSMLLEEEPVWASGISAVNTNEQRDTEEEEKDSPDPVLTERTEDDAHKPRVAEGEMSVAEEVQQVSDQKDVIGTALSTSGIDKKPDTPRKENSFESIQQVPVITDEAVITPGDRAGPEISGYQNPINQSAAVFIVLNEPETHPDQSEIKAIEQVPDSLENVLPEQSSAERSALPQVFIDQEGRQGLQKDRKDGVSEDPESSDSDVQGDEPDLLEMQQGISALDTVLETHIQRRSEELSNSQDASEQVRKGFGGNDEMHRHESEHQELIELVEADYIQKDGLDREIKTGIRPNSTQKEIPTRSDFGEPEHFADSLPSDKPVNSSEVPLVQNQGQTLLPLTSLPEQMEDRAEELEQRSHPVSAATAPSEVPLQQEQSPSFPVFSVNSLSEMPHLTEEILNPQKSQEIAEPVFTEQSENREQNVVIPPLEHMLDDQSNVPSHQYEDIPVATSTKPGGQDSVPVLSEMAPQMPLHLSPAENPDNSDASTHPAAPATQTIPSHENSDVPVSQELTQVPPLPFSASESQKPEEGASTSQPESDTRTAVRQPAFQVPNSSESGILSNVALDQVVGPLHITENALQDTPDPSQIQSQPGKPDSVDTVSLNESAEQLLLVAKINQGNLVEDPGYSLGTRENHGAVSLDGIGDDRQECPQTSPGLAMESPAPLEKKASHGTDSKPYFQEVSKEPQEANQSSLLRQEGSEPEGAEQGEVLQSDLKQSTLKHLEAQSKGHSERVQSSASPSLHDTPSSSPEADLSQQPYLETIMNTVAVSNTESISPKKEEMSAQVPDSMKAKAVLLSVTTPYAQDTHLTQVLPTEKDYEGLQSHIQVSSTVIQIPDPKSVASGPFPLTDKTESLSPVLHECVTDPTSDPSNINRQLLQPPVREDSFPLKPPLNSDTPLMFPASPHSSESGDNLKVSIDEEEKNVMEEDVMNVPLGSPEYSEFEDRQPDLSEEKGNLPLWEFPASEHIGKTPSVWLPDDISAKISSFPGRKEQSKGIHPKVQPMLLKVHKPQDEAVSQNGEEENLLLSPEANQEWDFWPSEVSVSVNKGFPHSSSSNYSKKRGLHYSSSAGKLLRPLQATTAHTSRILQATSPRTTWTALSRPTFLSPGMDKRSLKLGTQNPRPIIQLKLQKNPYESDWNKHVFKQYYGLTANLHNTLQLPTLTLRKPDSRHSSSQHIALRDIASTETKEAKERLFLKQLKESR